VLLADVDPPAADLLQACDQAQDGGLAAPGRADQHQELPGRHLQGDVLDRDHSAAEALADPIEPDTRRLRRPRSCHDYPFSAPAISPRKKNRPSSTYTTSVGREASRAAAIAWLNGMVCTLAMLFSPIVTGHPPRAVITKPNRKSFQAEVNCQMIETADRSEERRGGKEGT